MASAAGPTARRGPGPLTGGPGQPGGPSSSTRGRRASGRSQPDGGGHPPGRALARRPARSTRWMTPGLTATSADDLRLRLNVKTRQVPRSRTRSQGARKACHSPPGRAGRRHPTAAQGHPTAPGRPRPGSCRVIIAWIQRRGEPGPGSGRRADPPMYAGVNVRLTKEAALLAALAAGAASCAHPAVPPMPAPSASRLLGTAAPGFSRETVQGQRFDTAAVAGQVLLLDFFASSCPPCRRTLPALQALHERQRRQAQPARRHRRLAGRGRRGARALVARYALTFRWCTIGTTCWPAASGSPRSRRRS